MKLSPSEPLRCAAAGAWGRVQGERGADPRWGGLFPRAPLDWSEGRSGSKKQTGRLLEVECQECGLVVRQTKKWIDEVGPAHCPEHGEMVVADD